MQKQLDTTKPVQTRDGRKARIICTDRKGDSQCPILALVQCEDGMERLLMCGKDGKALDMLSDSNLINVPEKVTLFLNVYDAGFCYAVRAYNSHNDAKVCAVGDKVRAVAVPITIEI